MVLDTGGLYAALDRDDDAHEEAFAAVSAGPGPLILSPFVLAELDYLVQRRLGVRAECDLLDDVDTGVYALSAFDSADLSRATQLVRQYADLDVGITDASVVVLAAKHRTVDLLSLDHRHFRAMSPLRSGDAFRLLPLDP